MFIGLDPYCTRKSVPRVVDKAYMVKWGFATTVLTLLLIGSAKADRIVLQDGRTLEGDVVAENDTTVTIEMWAGGSSLTQQVNKSKIQTWYQAPQDGPAYVTIPIIGGIGDDITVDAVRAGLAAARAAHPKYIVLAVDSLGGDFDTMRGIVDLLNEASKEAEVVAYVKRAVSAAAVITMSCKQVYMLPGSIIGANVAWHPTGNGPADVDAKFRSFIDATVRAANDHGQHSDLLIRGMSELDLEIYLTQKDGQPILSASGPGKLIKSKGQILSMTADEAAECGLARTTTGLADVGNQVCGGAWHEASRRAWFTTLATVSKEHRIEREQIQQQQLTIAHQNAIAVVKPQLDGIERRIAELTARAIANQNAINDLTTRCNQELQQIDLEYQQTVSSIPPYVQPPQPVFDRNTTATDIANYNAWLRQNAAQQQQNRDAATARAAQVANARASAARQYLQANIAPLQADGQAAQIELGILRDKQRQLLATIPNN